MGGDQRIERRDRQGQRRVPALALPARCALGGGDEGLAGGGDGRVGGVEPQRGRARRGADQRGQARHRGIVAEEQAHQPRQPRLRLDRDDTGAEPPEARRAVADMGADVEGEVAGAEEPPVEGIECGRPARRVVDPEAPADRARRGHEAGGVS